jgi:hypothetical protein
MQFLRTFFGSFYSAATYRAIRYQQTGHGFRYTIQFLVLQMAAALAYLLVFHQGIIPGLAEQDLPFALQALLITAIAFVLRVGMLLGVSVATRLISLKAKPFMSMAAGLRVSAVAYTPIAVIDTAVFCYSGIFLEPWKLFLLAVAMVIAVAYASRGE